MDTAVNEDDHPQTVRLECSHKALHMRPQLLVLPSNHPLELWGVELADE